MNVPYGKPVKCRLYLLYTYLFLSEESVESFIVVVPNEPMERPLGLDLVFVHLSRDYTLHYLQIYIVPDLSKLDRTTAPNSAHHTHRFSVHYLEARASSNSVFV